MSAAVRVATDKSRDRAAYGFGSRTWRDAARSWTPGYDAAGTLRGYLVQVFNPDGTVAYTSTFAIAAYAGSP